MKLSLRSVPRIEGHAAVEVIIDDAERRCRAVRLKVFEGPRLFEYATHGRSWFEIPSIASRICGVCGYAHAVCAAMAVEDALGIEVDSSAALIRELALELNAIDSHLLHLAILMAPDVATEPWAKSVFLEALRLRNAVGKIAKRLFGDRIHPRGIVVGGASILKETRVMEDAEESRRRVEHIAEQLGTALLEGLGELRELVDVRIMPVAAEPAGKEMYLLGGEGVVVGSSYRIGKRFYRKYFAEATLSYSSSKKTLLYGRDPIIVGAAARISVRGLATLGSEARSLAEKLRLGGSAPSPLDIPLAQLVEVLGFAEKLPHLIDTAVREVRSIVETTSPPSRSGSGLAIVEAPRGLLYHSYGLIHGEVVDADIVTPTAHNVAATELSIESMVNTALNRGIATEEIKDMVEVLIRSFDPCISCAVHVTMLRER